MSVLEARLAALSPEKRRLLEVRIRKEREEREREEKRRRARLAVPPRDPDDAGPYPLTLGQERLWFIGQLAPGNTAYNIPFAGRLEGPLDPAALQGALCEVVRRHEVLRSRFLSADRRPAQAVDPPPRVPLPLVDLTALPARRRLAEWTRLAVADPRVAFDLVRGPVARFTLVRIAAGAVPEHGFLVTMPHIVTDAWSMAVLFRELPALYDAIRHRRPSPLPELPVQVADYALWQRRFLRGETLAKEQAFWKGHLAGAPTVLELPADRPRPPVQKLIGGRSLVERSAEDMRRVRALADAEGATSFMVLLAAFDVLLGRHTGLDDVLVGTPAAIRSQPETHGLIGFFIDNAVLRGDLSGNPTFRELLGRVRRSTVATLAHSELPFNKVVEALGIERDLSRPPLVQINFVLQNVHIPEPDFEDLVLLESRQTDAGAARFDLTVGLWFDPDGRLRGAFEYDATLYDPTTAERLARHYGRLLDAAVVDPDLPISRMSMLGAAERHQLLYELAGGELPAGGPSLSERFAEVARAMPDAVAVGAPEGDGAVSYGALLASVRDLAQRLRELGVGPEVAVGVSAERSAEWVVGLLAVVEAGGVYVPLARELPEERRRLIVGDAGVRVVMDATLLGSPLTPTLSPGNQSREDEGTAGGEGAGTAGGMYVIYTSGSTGTPKGAVVPFQGVLNTVDGHLRALRTGPRDRVLLNASIGFDASLLEVLLGLLSGARLEPLPRAALLSGAELARELRRRRITALVTAPGILGGISGADFPELGTVVLGGEKCPPELARLWARGRRFFNSYGPAEAAVAVSLHEAPPHDPVAPSGSVLAGRPLPGARCLVLDGRLLPLPCGVAGELLAGGAGLARGYLRRPGLSAERFVADPFSEVPGERLYRTGDRARWRTRGELELLGRLDDQVKIRGQRVEPGEVEAALRRHPAVREAAVVAREEASGARRLAAFVTAEAGVGRPAPEELRRFLASSLPDAMVPAAFAVVDVLPRTASGKVDRKALVRRDLPRPEPAAGPSGPRDEAEAALAAIWAEVLGLDDPLQVSVHDDFFALGGDSILSIRLLARAAEAGFRLTPQQVFSDPTIAGMAAVAEIAGQAPPEEPARPGPVPLTPVQRWFFGLELAEPHHWNMALLLEVREPIAPAVLERALAVLIDRHDALRLRFERRQGAWTQRLAASGGAVPLVRVDLSGLPVAVRGAASATVSRDLHGTLDLGRRLLAAALFELGHAGPGRLLFVVHHLAVDALSWRVLLEDLETSCRQLEAGDAPRLPPITTPFQRWAEKLSEHAGSPAVLNELDAWKSWARDLPEGALRLPVDEPEGADVEALARSVTREIAEDVTGRLLRGQAGGVTPEETLLAALAAAFAEWTGERSLAVDLEGHGRDAPLGGVDLSRTVGWFTRVSPLVLDDDDPAAVADRVRRARAGGLGYGVLRYLSDAGRDAARWPSPPVSFNYLGQVDLLLPAASRFVLAPERPAGPLRGLRCRRPHLVEINAFVRDGRLEVDFRFGGLHRRATIERLAERFAAALERLSLREPAAPPAREHPLSFAQERLWILDRMEPGNPAYHVAAAVRLRGPLDRLAVAASVAEIARRHEALRTAFPAPEGRPVQRVLPPAPVPLPVVDLGGLPRERREALVRPIARREAKRPFQLASGPLVRTLLVDLVAGERPEAILHLTVHHIVADGWSIGVLVRELGELYEGFVSRREDRAPLPDLPEQYGDFAREQRERLRGEVLEAELAFWRERLAGDPGTLDLPADRPRPAAQTYRGGNAGRFVSAELTGRLRGLGRDRGATLFMTLLAAFQVLLQRWSGRDDFLVGSPVVGRPREELHRLIGLFINHLVLRADLRGEPSFHDLLARVRETVLAALAHAELPFEKLVAELEPRRDLSRTPLFQVYFNMLSFPAIEARLAGVELEELPPVESLAMFDLTLYAKEVEGGVHLEAVYNADLFDRRRIEEALAQYELLLEQATAAPETTVGRYSLLTPAARAELPDPSAPLDAGWPGSIQDAVVRRAREAPDRTAVAGDAGVMSYGHLAASSGRLAARLSKSGVSKGDVVAIWAAREPALAVTVVGVLRAGAAFLILDPAYPAPRHAACLRQARPRAWVVLDAAPAVPAVLGELPADEVGHLIEDTVSVGPGDLAYVAFTSGSTGEPKGVLGLHRSLTHFLPWQRTAFELTADDRFSLLSGLAHDPLHRDLFTPFWLGAAVVVPGAGRLGDPGWLADWTARQRVTVAHLTPAMGRLLTTGPPGAAPTLRRAFFVGDVLAPADVARLRELAPEVRCVNFYGTTETQRAVGYHEVDAGAPVLPLGRGMPDVQLLVVRPDFELCGIGEVGEICVRSPHLAAGYLDDPELTAARFVKNPHGASEDDRLYRTGDLGRYLPTGDVVFAGRGDQQLKVRGFRVEPAEIEAALRRHPAVSEAAVVARDDVLVGYVVPAPGRPLDEREVRAFVAGQLPEHMVPSAVVALSEPPLTPNRKLDRAALAGRPLPASLSTAAAPRSPEEELVADVWRDVLGLDRVDAAADFFELGGHSLLATQAAARLADAFGVDVPVRWLFERPTPAALAERLTEARGTGGLPQPPPVRPVPRDGSLPVSFAQERLWFIDRFQPGDPSYNLPAALRLTGALDAGALARALSALAGRHETLRTTFDEEAGEPVQVVAPVADLPLARVDLAGLAPAVREAEALRLAGREARRPFDLGRTFRPSPGVRGLTPGFGVSESRSGFPCLETPQPGVSLRTPGGGRQSASASFPPIPERSSLLRIALLHLRDDEHVFLVNVHHSVSDGWSIGILIRELVALYRGFISGDAAVLPELPVQYADYATWQRRWLRGEVLERQLAYWREQLADVPVLELPGDRPRPAVRTSRGGVRGVRLPAELGRGLRRLAREGRVTLFMTLLAGFQALLARYTGQPDVAVGSPIAGRRRPEVEGLIGFFVNTLVLRTRLSGDPGFRELLVRVREAALAAYAHQDLPFEKLVAELAPERDLVHTPLFQVMLALQNPPPSRLDVPGLEIEALETPGTAARFDLALALRDAPQEDALAGTLEYSADLFDAATVDRLAGHLRTLLAAAAADSRRRLSDLPLLTAAESRQLAEWGSARRRPAGSAVHEAFEARADLAPDAVAVAGGGRAWTYGELEARSNRLARALGRRGVGPETVVAVCVEGSPDMVVALLSTLKAGGAYLPLDPSHPPERLAATVADARAPVVVTREVWRRRFADVRAEVIALDGDREIRCESAERPALGVAPASLAYVIYTSGSTGRPKGVELHHAGLAHLVAWHHRRYAVGPCDRASQVASPSFDAAVWEIWPYLAAGASVHFPDEETRLDPRRLYRWLADARIHLAFLPTPLAEALTAEEPPPGLALRELLVGGDRLRRAPPATPPCRLVNHYGPTESTVVATSGTVPADAAGPPAIGRPIDGVGVHLLDRRLAEVPLGVPGEICLAGAGLARGYLRRPALTAERFVPLPRAADAGERLYRTGDLARFLPSGELDFLGRLDHQVKVRGFRVELGEIEAALGEHPGVEQAVVVLDPDRSRLAAFVVPAGETAPGDRDLDAFLGRRLPAYMVPGAYEHVGRGSVPLTSSGKVDRAALRRRTLPRPTALPFTAPRSPLEEELAALWAEVLAEGTGEAVRFGVDDDFFSLGGHSLAAMRLVSRIRETLGVDLPVRRLFERPTIAGLAGELEDARRLDDGVPPLVRAEDVRAEDAGEAPASFAQERLWFLDQLTPESTAYNVPAAVRLRGRLAPDLLARVWREIARRHEALRTSLPARGGRPVQAVADESAVPFVRVDLDACPPAPRRAEARRLTSAEARRRFDLARGPLARAVLLRLEEEEHVLLLTLHHAVADEWSLAVLLREVAALYPAFAAGRPSPLAELPFQYSDYARWQRRRLDGGALERHLDWWKTALADLVPLALPADRPRTSTPSFRGFRAAIDLPAEASDALRRLGQRHGATLFMTLLAAFDVQLHRYGAGDDLAVGAPVANRGPAGTGELIGFFVNTVVLRCGLGGDPTLAELLDRVRETCFGAFGHAELPFERLVAELAPERDAGRVPLFQAMLALHNVARPTLELPGLALEPLPADPGTAKLDLLLELSETPGGLAGHLEASADLFDRTSVERMARHLRVLLGGLGRDPGARLSDLPLLADAERHQVTVEGNVGVRPAAGAGLDTLCLHELFAAQAAARPHAVAVVCGDERLTYAELERRALVLAGRLRELGVAPEVRVGLLAEPSADLVVAVLGILAAGGAYVPIDPEAPRERLDFTLDDARVALMHRPVTAPPRPEGTITGSAGILPAPSSEGTRPRPEGTTASSPGFQPGDTRGARPENAAYAIYTSGSTGQPKGTVVTHAQVARLLRSTEPWFGFGPGDVWTLFHSAAFDFSVWELWGALAHGGRLVVVPRWTSRSPEAFHELLVREKMTVLNQTPTAFRHLDEADAASADSLSLSWVIFGGESLEPSSLGGWLDRHGPLGPRLVNMYGITETTVHVTWRPMTKADVAAPGHPIGVPIPDLAVHLLDPRGRPVPLAVPGELHVGGAGVCRGYLERPGLTAERFTPDPFAGDGGARLYRSGDLARRRPSGELDFLGRIDDQVKVRGFRIEPAEIEAALAAHPRVRQAAVVARDDLPAGRGLVAYYVAAGEVDADLRAWLRERLPEHMVPSWLVPLASLPVTATGKLDRRALAREPAPGGARPRLAPAYVPPETALEEVLAGAWAEALGVDRVGRHDSFFDLGGHSLLATQVVSWVRETFEVEVPLADLFAAPTVAGLAAALLGDPDQRAQVERTAELFLELGEIDDEEVDARLAGAVEPPT